MNAIVASLYLVWRRLRDGARRSQPAIEILTAVALVWFAYATARTDERTANIQDAQRSILEAQNAPVFFGRVETAGTPDAPAERVVLGNAGAHVRPVRVCHLDVLRLEWLAAEPTWVHSSPVLLRLVQYYRAQPGAHMAPADHDRPPIVDVPPFRTVRLSGLDPGGIFEATNRMDFAAASRTLFADPATSAMLLKHARWYTNRGNAPSSMTDTRLTTSYAVEHYVAVVYADGLNRKSAALVSVGGDGAQVVPWNDARALIAQLRFDFDPSLPVRANLNPAPLNAFWEGLFDAPRNVFTCTSPDTGGTSGVFNIDRE